MCLCVNYFTLFYCHRRMAQKWHQFTSTSHRCDHNNKRKNTPSNTLLYHSDCFEEYTPSPFARPLTGPGLTNNKHKFMYRREIQYIVMDSFKEITFVRGCRQHNTENAIKFIALYTHTVIQREYLWNVHSKCCRCVSVDEETLNEIICHFAKPPNTTLADGTFK